MSMQTFHHWPELLPELQTVIRGQFLDLPTRWVLRQTCKTEYSAKPALPRIWGSVLTLAAEAGYVGMCQWLVETLAFPVPRFIRESYPVSIGRWLYDTYGILPTIYALESALEKARTGHGQMVRSPQLEFYFSLPGVGADSNWCRWVLHTCCNGDWEVALFVCDRVPGLLEQMDDGSRKQLEEHRCQ